MGNHAKETLSRAVVPAEVIQRRILLVRGRKAMLDRDLAILYRVKSIALRQAVKQNNRAAASADSFTEQGVALSYGSAKSSPPTNNSPRACSRWRRSSISGSKILRSLMEPPDLPKRPIGFLVAGGKK